MKENKLSDHIKIHTNLPLFLGGFAMILSLLPAILLGADGYVGIHDQMDGEILVYIINARHFLASSFAEFMNGMAATSLTPPSYGSLLFYLVLPPFTAYLCNYLFVSLVAFAGMYLLLNSLLDNKWLSVFVAVMFTQLPFYSVYGLSVMGQPLLFYACLRLLRKKTPWITFIVTALFGFFSSLVLVGYADIFLLVCFSTLLSLRKHSHARFAWLQLAILIVVYLMSNFTLLRQILLPSDVISHKSELIAAASSIRANIKDMFHNGAYHAASLQTCFVGWAIYGTLAGFVFYQNWKPEEKQRLWWLFALLVAAFAIAVFYGLWHWGPVVQLRNQLGGLFVSFQADRFYWLNPLIWFTIFGLLLWFLLQLGTRAPLPRIAAWLCCGILVFQAGTVLYNNSVFKRNIHILAGESAESTWDDFYSPELFQEIEDYIGLPQQDYRVASVALYPSVPLYNGFYCIDGYSNNYDVVYKHQFRNIISKELEKSPSLREYYDGWGNRCYLFSAELGKSYYFPSNSGRKLENLELSSAGLKALHCDYIFSGIEILNPSVSGLEFLEYFDHPDSPYGIYLYRVIS